MEKQLFIKQLFIAILLMSFVSAGFAQQKDLPNVVILATGGTIAG